MTAMIPAGWGGLDGDVVIAAQPVGVVGLNVGCGTHYAAGWCNTDVHRDDDTQPDLLVHSSRPFPFPDNWFGRINLSHVLEHIRLDDVPDFLAGAMRVLAPGGEVLVTGPDAHRTIKAWHEGSEPWDLVCSVLEHAAYPGTTDWPQALHHWNCNEARVVEALNLSGFVDIEPLTDPPPEWPTVNWSNVWQCCVKARKAPA